VGRLRTLNDVLALAGSRGDETVLMAQGAGGVWEQIGSRELRRRVTALACALAAWGLKRGERVAMLSENRWEWAVTDFAVLALGAVDVPLFPTLTKEQAAYALADSGARVAVVSTRAQRDKVLGVLAETSVELVLVMDAGEGEQPTAVRSFAEFLESGDGQLSAGEFDALLEETRPEELATLIYTSGTTGDSKGVMLTHGNIAANLNYSTCGFDFDGRDVSVSFLPLSHITARHLDYALLLRGCALAYCPEVSRLLKVMLQVRPTVFVAVPRVYEKVRQSVEQKAGASAVRANVLRMAMGIGKEHMGRTLRGERQTGLGWSLAERLVFRKIRSAFGGRVRHFISGGAPLGMTTATWFAQVGIRIHEGYGLTETSPVVALNTPLEHRMGTVGRALDNVQCRLAEDGELEVRGPSIFGGYWQKPEMTAESFTEDGWFKTGDIAVMDSDGYLSITDRKKEMLKTSNGKLIAPQPIEGLLKGDPLVSQAAVVGDRHKYLSALISPNLAALKEWARRHGVVYDDTTLEGRLALVQEPQVVKVFKGIVDTVNRQLPPHEAVKRFQVVPEEWTIETGEMTPSMKLKRRVIVQRYAAEIAAFYYDESRTPEFS